jgi:hypothetical protein
MTHRIPAFTVALFLSLVGCNLDPSKKSAADAGDAGISPENVCLEYAQVLATAGQRCGQDYHVVYNDFIQAAARGDCASVTAIRDFDALWNTCLVVLQNESCADLSAGVLDKSCKNQLIVN